MPAPTFVASYNSPYTATGSPQTLSITTQAGDVLVIYAGTADSTTTLNPPTGNSITFTEQQEFFVSSNCSTYLWTGTDNNGGTNWTLSCTTSAGAVMWGFTCVVFRNSSGVGATAGVTNLTGAPTTTISTNQDNSAIVVFSDDWNAVDGTTRTWSTVNSITPTAGNGLELTYARDSANYTVYGAYYNNAGSAGSKTIGISSPSGQKYSVVAMEVLGSTTTAPAVTTNAVTNVASTTATGNGNVTSDGGGTITERGVCWSTNPNPTTSDSKATSAGTTGAYSVSMTGLSTNTLYHARAYAINAVGTTYGSDITFSTYRVTISWLGI